VALLYNHASNLESANGASGAVALQFGRSRSRLQAAPLYAGLSSLPIRFDANVTALAGTTPGVQFIVETSWDAVNWYTVYSTAVIQSTGVQPTQILGTADRLLGPVARLRWLISGTVGPSATFTASLNTVY
jgi:hypothetical protein